MNLLFAVIAILLVQLFGSALSLYMLDTRRKRRAIKKGFMSLLLQ